MPRYFTYRYSGERQQIGSGGAVYNFAYGSVTQVDNNDDADGCSQIREALVFVNIDTARVYARIL